MTGDTLMTMDVPLLPLHLVVLIILLTQLRPMLVQAQEVTLHIRHRPPQLGTTTSHMCLKTTWDTRRLLQDPVLRPQAPVP